MSSRSPSPNPDAEHDPEFLPMEDPLADDMDVGAREAEEEEGEDLFGADMARDYEAAPEEDQYDPDMLDEEAHEPITLEQRMAADKAMKQRDAQERRRRRGMQLESSPSPSPERSEDGARTFGTERRKRRRLEGGEAAPDMSSDVDGSEAGGELGDDADVPEVHYDLNREELNREDTGMDKRLETKIRLSFQQFLRKFVPEGAEEPKYPDLLKRMAEEAQMHLDVSFLHLQQWSPQLALWVAEHPVRILRILNETLMAEAQKKFLTYADLAALKEENELRVAIHSFPIREPIRELKTNHLGKLVNVHGVVTKRGGLFNQVKRLYLRCAKCSFACGPFECTEEKELRPGSCIECQSKGPWRVDRQRTLYRNRQKITLQETPSTVEPGKMPRSKEVIITGDQADTIRPGDELSLTGIYRCLHDAPTNARTCFPVFRTELESVSLQKKGDIRISQITEDVVQQIMELSKDPNIRERFIASMAPSIYGMKHVKTCIALSMLGGERKERQGKHRIRGDLNTLIVGDPGLAKSQFLKYVEQTVPRAVYTTGKGASGVGLTASVTRDENGDWGLQGGAMVLADDGMCLIDEFDKMNDQDRTSLHEAMEQQTISLSKAGIVATLQARCSVVAVANPIDGRYDPQRTFSQNVNLTDPILSRFDCLCVLRDDSDPVQDERLADHVVCSHIRSHPDANSDDKTVQPKLRMSVSHVQPIEQDLLQKYIAYARERVHPKMANLDKDKLANFYSELRAEAFKNGGAPMTARHVDSIVRLAEAHAKMELRQHVTNKDLDNAISVTLESFIQSQKHQVAEELRVRFRKYLTAASPHDQFMAVMDKLFRDKTDQMRLARPGGEAPEAGEVGVEMADVVRLIERHDLDMDEAHRFMGSTRWKQNYRLVGERIFRVLN
mmetsp:Transcript_69419/g.203740  ORF Transcript_69419/g.203740 Transcript_69419/m.203740 type:complete len:899 (-) Transcript_69419:431-3127(-)